MVSGVGPSIDVLDGDPAAAGVKGLWEVFAPFGFNGVGLFFTPRNIFDLCMKS